MFFLKQKMLEMTMNSQKRKKKIDTCSVGTLEIKGIQKFLFFFQKLLFCTVLMGCNVNVRAIAKSHV